MAVNAIGSTNSYYYEDQTQREPVKSLDKDAFLQLMIQQLRYQDPTSPMDTNQMVEQMATFTTLEQLTNLNTNFERMYSLQMLSYGSSLIGHKVTLLNGEETIEGTVERVTMGSDGIKLVLDNGKTYYLEQVMAVERGEADGSKEPDTSTGDNLNQQDDGSSGTT